MNTVGIYHANPGDHVRIGFESTSGYHPLLWIEVRKDNSIYIGPRIQNVTTFRKGAKPVADGTVTIGYDEGTDVPAPHRKQAKVSFHGSGRIKGGGDYLRGIDLRGLNEQREICKLLFPHPSKFAAVAHLKPRDIMLRYPVDPARPLLGCVYAAPTRSWSPITFQDATHQETMALHYAGLDFVDLCVQVILYHGLEGTWPPYSYILFRARNDTDQNVSAPVPPAVL